MSEAARAMMRTWVERSFWGRRSITATTTRFENRLTTTEEMGCQHHIIPTFLKILLYGYLSKSPYPLRQSPTFVRLGGGIICCARRGKLHENLPIKRTYSPTGMFLAGRKMAQVSFKTDIWVKSEKESLTGNTSQAFFFTIVCLSSLPNFHSPACRSSGIGDRLHVHCRPPFQFP